MKSTIVILLTVISCLFIYSSCGKPDSNDISSNAAEAANVSYDYLCTDCIRELLKKNTKINGTVKICSPTYAYDLDVESLSVNQHSFVPYDATVIFPVLENKKIVGFIYYFSNENECGDNPLYMPISNEAYTKLKKKHTLKISLARWKSYDGYHVNYMYISDDNEVNSLFDDYYRVPYGEGKDIDDIINKRKQLPTFQIDYDKLSELDEININSLEVIMTLEISAKN